VLATVALAGLAWIVSFATEQVGERFGPAVTGVLQSTLGNLPEFFIVMFALSAGEIVVARTSIIGSIFANALLVLGLVIIAGCSSSVDGVMRFHVRLPKDNATLMLLASFLIVILGISAASGDRASGHVEAISIVGAIALLVTYGVWLADYLRSDLPQERSHVTPRTSFAVAVVLLGIAGVGAAFVSDWFVTALTPATHTLHMSEEFAGLVIVAIAGNAVENVVGVQLAARNKPEFAIGVIVNSSLQVALALTPVLIFVSLVFTTHLTLVFPTLLALVLVIAAILGALVVNDGESTWQEGVVLVGFYVVIAASFWWGT